MRASVGNSPIFRKGSSSQPLLPSNSRGLSIRSPAAMSPQSPGSPYLPSRFRPRNRRLGLLLLLAGMVGYALWKAAGTLGEPTSQLSKLDQEKCRLFPWMAKCIGTSGKDPFGSLHYDREGGRLSYPAHHISEQPTEVPPPQPHPIHLLMEQAERDWTKKVERQSKTLREAVEEYETRYKRRPPKGFEQWFKFAKQNDFVLVDEFDSLNEKLLPFLALSPGLLQRRAYKVRYDKEFWIQDKVFTVELRNSGNDLTVDGPKLDKNERPEQMLKLLEGIAPLLPDLNITFTFHDVPWVVLSGEARESLKEKAILGQYEADEKAEDYQDNWDYDGWAVICPPDSAIRKAARYEERKETWTPPAGQQFIHDHVAAMDLCSHPRDQPIHGFTAWEGPRPGLLYPIFSFTSTSMHSDFLAPPIDQYDRRQGKDPAWELKKIAKVVWRGTTTGADLNLAHMRKWSQRPRLCRLPFEGGRMELPYAPGDQPDRLGNIANFTASAQGLAWRYFDFKFLGEPEQCDDAKACARFKKEFAWDTWMSEDEQNEYKYVIDVDGNGWSGRFHRLMSSNSLVLKSTIFPEWYADHIVPWYHYVPIATDYSDLYSVMAFFVGDDEGVGDHDDLAKKIAMQGKKWAEEHWRWEDMEVYFYRLLLEYARIMHRDPNDPHSMDM